jgi:hypothetical protein
MFESPTLFIVGAGASREANLPIGNMLTEHIAALLSFEVEFGNLTHGDWGFFGSLKSLANAPEHEKNSFLASSKSVAEAMQLALSIDTFLHSHRDKPEYVQLGKLAIARAIAQAESNSLLKRTSPGPNGDFDIGNMGKTWYHALAQLLFNGIDAQHPKRAFENLTFIVFNYDRCLQIYLRRAIQVYFQISTAAATEIVRGVRFIHPYGWLGSPFEEDPTFVPFGADYGGEQLIDMANRIKTFTERSDQSVSITESVYRAENIIFLGFGFHRQNMELLSIRADRNNEDVAERRIYATTFGMSDSDADVVKAQISGLFPFDGVDTNGNKPLSIYTCNGKCNDLFGQYWHSLSN